MHERVHNLAEVAGDEDVGKRLEERVERPVRRGRMSKLTSDHFTRPSRDRNGAQPGKVSLWDHWGGFVALGAGICFLNCRLIVATFSVTRICTMIRSLSFASQILA